jgi:hypothetical protein
VHVPKVVDHLNQVLFTYDDEIAGSISYAISIRRAAQ